MYVLFYIHPLLIPERFFYYHMCLVTDGFAASAWNLIQCICSTSICKQIGIHQHRTPLKKSKMFGNSHSWLLLSPNVHPPIMGYHPCQTPPHLCLYQGNMWTTSGLFHLVTHNSPTSLCLHPMAHSNNILSGLLSSTPDLPGLCTFPHTYLPTFWHNLFATTLLSDFEKIGPHIGPLVCTAQSSASQTLLILSHVDVQPTLTMCPLAPLAH